MSCVPGDLKPGDQVTHCDMPHAGVGTVVDVQEGYVVVVRWPGHGASLRYGIGHLTKITASTMGRMLSQ